MPDFVADVVGTYTIELVVDNGVISSESDSVQVTVQELATGTATTDGVLCDYDYNEFNDSESVQLTSSAQWSCVDGERLLVANGIPDHEVGEFPNSGNPNTISEQSVSANYTLTPEETGTASELGGPRGPTGYVLNGVKIDASTAGSCEDLGENCSLIDNSGSWNIEALGHSSFDFGTDDNNAHVQPEGTYHYHGMPEGFITLQGGNSETITLIGWAADGFPIYARYGYSEANNPDSDIVALTGSYQLVGEVSDLRPSVDVYSLGTFAQDWEYVEGSGDLDECNGRFGVTPEFPDGIYHYYATDTYPYFQRCVTGDVGDVAGGPPQ
ncbi:YHYH protein [Alteromonas sp. 5E99-2]|nr:YHYH protein [Alteromonas sp. 5E99-2]